MQVIPVIDVRGGVAVAAVRGDRARYRPLETPLAPSADPVAVAEGLRTLHPFATLYIADLDGIEGRGADGEMQRRLAAAWPGSEVWIDDGGSSPLEWGASCRPRSTATRVVGSESLASLDAYRRTRNSVGADAPLSLDFRGDAFIGPPELLADAALWPRSVIVMTLARIGSGQGPDLARLAAIVARAEDRRVFAAGGVRDRRDLDALRDIGVAGALVATALHAGAITARDLDEIA